MERAKVYFTSFKATGHENLASPSDEDCRI